MRPPRLLAVTDPAGVPPPSDDGWSAWCAALAAAGVDGLQLRDRGLSDRERFVRAAAARAALPPPFRLFVNGRADLAVATGADGVQLPAAGLPIAPLRAVFGERLLLGRSTHSLAEVARAADEGADFVIFGPVFETPSKAGRLAPRGISSLTEAAKGPLPVLAIGGVDAGNAAEIAAAGAWGIAAIRLFADPDRDRAALLGLRALWPPTTAR